jgi:hypothetical protein
MAATGYNCVNRFPKTNIATKITHHKCKNLMRVLSASGMKPGLVYSILFILSVSSSCFRTFSDRPADTGLHRYSTS